MKTIKFLSLAMALAFTTIACDDNNEEVIAELEVKTVSNLHAPQESDYTTNPPTVTGDYVKFSFKTGTTVTGDDWDIAFRGLRILVNSGTATAEDQPTRTGTAQLYIENSTFNNVTEINSSLFKSDDETDGLAIAVAPNNDWYTYDSTTHLVSATAGKIIVVKTNDGNYAKMEIVSYYKDGDTSGEARYYTFNYVLQTNGTEF